MEYWAHSPNEAGAFHTLADHLRNTAELASRFAEAWKGGEWGHLAGLCHDLGKVSPQFQAYVRSRAARGGDHSSLGACAVPDECDLLKFALAGHHAGLQNREDLNSRLKGAEADATVQEGLARASEFVPELGRWQPSSIPDFVSDYYEVDLFIRMLFSALVDADFLDTERHFEPGRQERRGRWKGLQQLWRLFERSQRELMATAQATALNSIRSQVYQSCLAAAERPQGYFSLTVPTGGGKTLSAMGFALRHALKWDLQRVVVVIPYTSIIEQTADVYRGVFGSDAVLEHHSAIDWREVEDSDRERCQLASENWDAPIIVTTSVQFFESLFSHRSARCRKLHNIAGSVVIIDEVQTIPTALLRPTFRMLTSLVKHYSVTVLLSTATQPAYSRLMDETWGASISEIVEDADALCRRLKRVEYDVGSRAEVTTLDWKQVAGVMTGASQAMAVVNTKADARALYRELSAASRVHLSTDMCGAHRRQVLSEVRKRLEAGAECHLATTQLVEAGVDIDFPLVLRAIGPLDRIVQAAGRCNREGRLQAGRVVVFQPREGGMPKGAYRTGADTAVGMFRQGDLDLHNPSTHTEYFRWLYQGVNLDAKQIDRKRERLQFQTVAREYRLIEDNTIAVAVPWDDGEAVLDAIEARTPDVTREDLRALQPYFVNLYEWQFAPAQDMGLCRELAPGLWRWEGVYDSELGLLLDADETSHNVL